MQINNPVLFPAGTKSPLQEKSNIFWSLILALFYLTINAVFVLKYGSRIVTPGWLLVILYLAATAIIFRLLKRAPSRLFTSAIYISITIVFCIFVLMAFLIIPQASLRVDRYEMIRLFWDNAFAGINPYTPRKISTNIPGPFPCYFVLALPFYWLKEIGLLSLSGFVLFACLLYRNGANMKAKTISLLLLVGSPAFAWEIICRSTIFLNMVLVAGLIQQMEQQSIGGFSLRAGSVYGVLTGLVACTRSVTILALVPYFLYLWSNHRAPLAVPYSLSSIVAFCVPFLPFLAYTSFFRCYNPFVVQTSIMPWPATFVVGLISCAAALRLKDFSGFVFFQSVCLFIVTFLFVSLRIFSYGWHDSLIGDKADISYLILVFPFLFISIAHALSWVPGNAAGEQ